MSGWCVAGATRNNQLIGRSPPRVLGPQAGLGYYLIQPRMAAFHRRATRQAADCRTRSSQPSFQAFQRGYQRANHGNCISAGWVNWNSLANMAVLSSLAATSRIRPSVAWPLPNRYSASSLTGNSASAGTPKASTAAQGGNRDILLSVHAHSRKRARRANRRERLGSWAHDGFLWRLATACRKDVFRNLQAQWHTADVASKVGLAGAIQRKGIKRPVHTQPHT